MNIRLPLVRVFGVAGPGAVLNGARAVPGACAIPPRAFRGPGVDSFTTEFSTASNETDSASHGRSPKGDRIMRTHHTTELSYLASLRNLSLFSRCTTKQLREIDRVTTEISVKAGRVLTPFRQPGSEFFVILSGTAGVWRNGVKLDALGPGSFFGEMAIVDQEARSADVTAETDMRLLVISRNEFRATFFSLPPVVEQMINELSRRLRRADEGWVTRLSAQQAVKWPTASRA